MLLFTTILNIKTTKKSKIIYVIIWGIVGYLIRNFIPDPYGALINIPAIVVLIRFILKTSWLKSFLAEFLSIGISSVLELFVFKLYLSAFHVPYELMMTAPFYRVISTLSIYLCFYLIYRIIRYCKFHIDLENMSKHNKILFFGNTILGMIAIGTQFYLISFYSDKMPIAITVVSMLSLLAYFIISFYSLFSTNKLDTTARNLEKEQLYNKTLTILHDNMRGFKHDFHNIVQGLGGYIDRKDLDGLKNYYMQLLQDCNRVNNLTALSPAVINNPAIYNILAAKYHRADENGIQINLAIEASIECNEKVINVVFRKEDVKRRLSMLVENTYIQKDIDIDKIFEKSYSTKSKKTNSGLGLWEIRQILRRNNHLNLFTSKNDTLFKQQFEIYY